MRTDMTGQMEGRGVREGENGAGAADRRAGESMRPESSRREHGHGEHSHGSRSSHGEHSHTGSGYEEHGGHGESGYWSRSSHEEKGYGESSRREHGHGEHSHTGSSHGEHGHAGSGYERNRVSGGRSHTGSSRMQKPGRGRKRRVLLYVLTAVPVTAVAVFASFLVVKAVGRASLAEKTDAGVPSLVSDTEYAAEEEGVIYRDGKKYRYNENLVTILCMGIDSGEENLEAGEMGSGGQSDANFLLVIDEAGHRLSVIAIPRDTMTDIDLYDIHGQYFDTVPAQLALQYAYGDGAELSCGLMKKSVSNLFYNLPIHACVSVNMNAVPVLNDAVGGVTVEALEDISRPGLSVKKGQSITLTGEQARIYVRTRETEEDYSAVSRLQRQKQYLLAFISSAFSAVREDLMLPARMYGMVTDYMVTDISASEVTYLATAAVSCSFTEDSFYMLPGEQRLGSYYEEYYIDEDALYDLILEVFYTEEEE